MRGLHMNMKHPARKGYANGGMVRGPGTGTSDDIEDEVPVGSYILPADTTKAVGPQMLDGMQSKAATAPAGLRGAQVPVAVSNGEYELTPEQVHAVGVKTLDGMKNATHKPVGMRGAEDPMRMFFANGGAVNEEERARLANQTAMYVQGAQQNAATAAANAPPPAAPLEQRVSQIPTGGMPNPAPTAPPAQAPSVLQTDPQARADRETIAGVANSVADSLGNAGRAVADVASMPVRGVAGAVDSTVVRGLRAAGVNAPYISPSLVPQGVDPSSMTPFTDQKRMQQATPATPAAAPAAPAAPATPATAPTAAAPTAATPAPVPGATGLDGVRSTDIPVAAPAAAPSAGAAPQVFRVGNSFSDTQAGAAAGAVPRGMPSAQNVAAADALAARSGAESMARVAAPAAGLPGIAGVTAPTVRTSANDWQTRKDLDNLRTSALSITNNGGRFDRTKGNNAAQNEFRAAVQADATARGAQPNLDAEAMRQTGGLQRETLQQQGGIQREQIQQSGANTRSARGLAVDRERLGIDRSRVSSENTARDVTTQGAQQLQQLRNVLLDPNATPAQRKQAESSLRAIGGKADTANRYTVVPGGQEISPQGLAYTRPAQVLDNQTGQFIQQGAGAPQTGPAQPTSKAEYDALPKGTQYIKDGKVLIKG